MRYRPPGTKQYNWGIPWQPLRWGSAENLNVYTIRGMVTSMIRTVTHYPAGHGIYSAGRRLVPVVSLWQVPPVPRLVLSLVGNLMISRLFVENRLFSLGVPGGTTGTGTSPSPIGTVTATRGFQIVNNKFFDRLPCLGQPCSEPQRSSTTVTCSVS